MINIDLFDFTICIFKYKKNKCGNLKKYFHTLWEFFENIKPITPDIPPSEDPILPRG